MKMSRYTEEQIAFALRQAETGTPVAEVVWKMWVGEQTFYRWKKQYAGMGVGEIRRLKQVLVESFVGAIALGWLFAQGIEYFANIFAAPVAAWIMRRQYRGFTDRAIGPAGFSLLDALPELVRSFSLLLVWYILLRWLYFKPLKKETPQPTPNPEQAA
jgi:putative transposase